MLNNPIYIVTDVELDGFVKGVNSMLSFGSVAVTADGRFLSEFEANLARLDGAEQDPGVMDWWATEPEAYAASTRDPEPAAAVMPRFAAWVRGLPGDAIFAAHPLALDGPWIDHYLECFHGRPAVRTSAPRWPPVQSRAALHHVTCFWPVGPSEL